MRFSSYKFFLFLQHCLHKTSAKWTNNKTITNTKRMRWKKTTKHLKKKKNVLCEKSRRHWAHKGRRKRSETEQKNGKLLNCKKHCTKCGIQKNKREEKNRWKCKHKRIGMSRMQKEKKRKTANNICNEIHNCMITMTMTTWDKSLVVALWSL